VNPVATLLSAKTMMDWLGETDKGAALERAIARVIWDGKVCIYDMSGSSMTPELAEAVASCL